ncbi:growth hormone secretagogue receptor type 1-like [Dreissena polymorpha]|uniref:growth hormone secretagogue receptor type 1-like n=1 Tax=Dreissena polymorpha TaxID=45954 RepID=UPI00226496FF|nr:growth hormone secretagogue receptor type 1-like [Dreissena polymorpha]
MSVLLPSFVYISVLIVAGIPGNVISLLVYGLHLTKVTGRYALITLAVCDIVNCVLSIPVELYIITEYWTFANASLCKMSRFMTYAMNNSSGLILLMIAIERYRAICLPHKTKIQDWFIQKMCVSLVIAGTFLALPALIIYGIQTDVAHTVDADDHIELLKSDVHTRSLGNFTMTSTNVDYVITKRCLIDDAWRGTAFAYSHFAFVSIASVLVLLILIVLYAQIGPPLALSTLAITGNRIFDRCTSEMPERYTHNSSPAADAIRAEESSRVICRLELDIL